MYSNDPETPKLTLALKGEVVTDVLLTPPSVSFGSVMKREPAEKELKIAVNEPEKVSIKSVEPQDDRFEVVLKEGDPKKSATYTVKYKGSDKLDRVASTIRINLEGAGLPFAEARLSARIVGNLKYPASVYLGKRDGEFKSRDIKITTRNGKPVKVIKVEDPDSHLKFEMDKKQGAEVVIKTSVADPTKAEYEKPVRGTLKITTNDKDEPELSLRYTVSGASPRRRPGGAMGHGMPKGLQGARAKEVLKKRAMMNRLNKPTQESKK